MALDIYQTHFMLPVVQQIIPRKAFLKDRYFPDTVIFNASDVLCEYKKGNKKIAPYISPRRGGVTSYREGYETMRFSPVAIGEKRVLTVDDLQRKGFGESIFSNLAPDQRQAAILSQDLKDMTDRIIGTEELMAAQCILNNAITGKVYYGKFGSDEYEDWEISYFDGDQNPASYTPAAPWTADSTTILDDLYAMAQMLKENGLPATDFVCAPDVAAMMIKNPQIQQFLDNRRYELGRVDPKELSEGVVHICTLNCYGVQLDVFSDPEMYEDEEGNMVPYIPAGYGFVSAPGAGEAVYAAITQLEQSTGQFATYADKRVPKYISDAASDIRTIELKSRPLLKPVQKNPWISAKLV